MMHPLKELKDLSSPQFKKSIEIYESSFPSNETRPSKEIEQMLKTDDNYHLYVFLNTNEVVGISLLYNFKDLHVGLLDYMAVTKGNQRKGIGTQLFNFTLKGFEANVLNGVGLLFEIQKENVLDERERDKRIRRIRFYERLGAKILEGVNYLLPPLQPDVEPEEMYLMIKPCVETSFLSKDSTVQYIEAIYSKIYKYRNYDLLNRVEHKLPEKIFLRHSKME